MRHIATLALALVAALGLLGACSQPSSPDPQPAPTEPVVTDGSLGSATVTTWRDNKAAAYTQTFDDGIYNSLVTLQPLLAQHHIVATMALITNWIDGGANLEGYSIGTWAQFKALLDSGTFTVASHTADHKNLTSLDAAGMDDQFAQSIQDIQTHTGYTPEVLFYPLSKSNAAVDTEAAKYFLAARNCNDTETPADAKDFYELNAYSTIGNTTVADMNGWVDKAIADHGWVTLLSHGTDGEAYGPTPHEAFDAHWAYVDSLSSQVWVADYASVVKYMKERQAANVTKVSAGDSAVVLDLTDSLGNAAVYNQPLTLRVKVPATWASVRVTQGGDAANLPVVAEAGGSFVYASGVPNQGPVTVTRLTSVAGLPGVPSGLAALATSTTQINITWAASEGATGYDLEVDGAVSAGASRPFVHQGLTAASTHTYRVRAVNGKGASDWSAPVQASSKAVRIPAVPVNVLAQASGPDTIAITWYPSEGATSYDVQSVSEEGAALGTPIAGITAASYAVTGLTTGTTGYFRVRAVNGAGASAWSLTVGATTSRDFLTNGGFENGQLAPFSIDTSGSVAQSVAVVDDPANAHSGRCVLLTKNVQGTDTSTYDACLVVTNLVSGHSYTLSFWSKVNPGASLETDLYLTGEGGGGTWTFVPDETVVVADGSWTLHTISFTLSDPGDNGFSVYLPNTDKSHPDSDHFVYLDDFSLIENVPGQP